MRRSLMKLPGTPRTPVVSPLRGLAAPLRAGAEAGWILFGLGGTSVPTAQLQNRAATSWR